MTPRPYDHEAEGVFEDPQGLSAAIREVERTERELRFVEGVREDIAEILRLAEKIA
jgi:hypothetical protein